MELLAPAIPDKVLPLYDAQVHPLVFSLRITLPYQRGRAVRGSCGPEVGR
jgi:hypothetical protein